MRYDQSCEAVISDIKLQKNVGMFVNGEVLEKEAEIEKSASVQSVNVLMCLTQYHLVLVSSLYYLNLLGSVFVSQI